MRRFIRPQHILRDSQQTLLLTAFNFVQTANASGPPRKSSKFKDRLLKLIQLQDRGTTSAELSREWSAAGAGSTLLGGKGAMICTVAAEEYLRELEQSDQHSYGERS